MYARKYLKKQQYTICNRDIATPRAINDEKNMWKLEEQKQLFSRERQGLTP